jgi:hypothetical protein
MKEVVIPRRRKVARSLCFEVSGDGLDALVFAATPDSFFFLTCGTPDSVTKKTTRRGKKRVVQSAERRFTRNYLKKEGLRPTPVVDSQVRPNKKHRAKLWGSPWSRTIPRAMR